MKRILAIIIILGLLVANNALADEISGMTIDEFLENAKAVHPTLGTATNVAEKRTFALAYDGATMFYAYTFPNSEVIEFANGLLKGTVADVAYIAAFMLSEDAQERVDSATEAIAQIDIASLNNKKWAKNEPSLIGNYYAEIYKSQGTTGDNEILWLWLHSSSKIKDKDAALAVVKSGYLPAVKAIADYRLRKSEDEQNEKAQAIDGAIILTSGEYECPAHIPAGEYKVTPIKSASIMTYRDGTLRVSEYLDADDKDEIGRIVLKAGDEILISGGELQFIPIGE